MEGIERRCEHCQKILVQRAKEKPVRFRTRRFCCNQCFYHHKSGLIYGLPRTCQQCSKPLVQRTRESPAAFERRLSCDKTCANRYKNDQVRGKPNPKLQGANNGMYGHTHTPAAIAIIREARKKQKFTKEQRQRRSEVRRGTRHSKQTRDKMSASRVLWWSKQPLETLERIRQDFVTRMPMRPRFRKTGIERRVAKELDRLGISYLWNTPLLGKFNVDFLLEEQRIVVECDGTYWHSLPETVVRDLIKNKELPEAGYILLRFDEQDILRNLDNCIQRIVDAMG